MAKVIFNRPVKLGKAFYAKSPFAQVVDDKLMELDFVKGLAKDGYISVQKVEQTPKAEAKPAKSAQAAK